MATTLAEAAPVTDPKIGYSAWPLPVDDTCPGIARDFLRQALEGQKLPKDLIYDATLAVSELAANLVQHVMNNLANDPAQLPAGGPELWLYRRRRNDHGQIVCKTFDPQRDWTFNPPPGMLDERGRGLAIVDAIVSEWGCHLTRSVLGGPAGPVRGKAVWFAMAIPRELPAAEASSELVAPVRAAHELRTLLLARGIDARCHQDGNEVVVSIPGGSTVRCRDRTFVWVSDHGRTHRSIADLVDVAEHLVRIHEERDTWVREANVITDCFGCLLRSD